MPYTRYTVQVKHDGAYCEVHTDAEGKVSDVLSRSGRSFGEISADLVGIKMGAPHSVLVGELEAYTDRGLGDSHGRGWRNVHLFDCLAYEGQSIESRPYRERRDALWRGNSLVVSEPGIIDTHVDGKKYRSDSGRFQRGPRDWRRFPIVSSWRPNLADELWDKTLADVIEGLVVVALDAPVGRRRAKRKCKPKDTLDAVVLVADGCIAQVRSFRDSFFVGCKGLVLEPGNTVEILHNGWYRDGTPRFPRIKRRRDDL